MVKELPIEHLRPNARNARKNFDELDEHGEKRLDQLADSIRRHGIIQPILARRIQANGFEIIAGERRWRAAQLAQLHEVPVTIIDADDLGSSKLALIENIQRADLNPIEEAQAYADLLPQFGNSVVELGHAIAKNRKHVDKTLRLLKLSPKARQLVTDGRLARGHAYALLSVPAADRDAVAQSVVDNGLTVREVEKLAEKKKPKTVVTWKYLDTIALEKQVSDALGLPVSIEPGNCEAGKLSIRFENLNQLDLIARKLKA